MRKCAWGPYHLSRILLTYGKHPNKNTYNTMGSVFSKLTLIVHKRAQSNRIRYKTPSSSDLPIDVRGTSHIREIRVIRVNPRFSNRHLRFYFR